MKEKPEGARVTIYRSTGHGALFVVSYICGAALILGCALWSEFALKEREGKEKLPWIGRTLVMAEVFFGMIMGTVIVLAPTKLIKSLSIVKAAAPGSSSPYSWEFEVKRMLPFLKPDVLRASFRNTSLDRSLAGRSLSIRNVPMQHVKNFSAIDFQDPVRRTVLDRIRNTWPAMKREVKRMMLQDQIARVIVVNNGKFKLDLRDCLMLDEGKPLLAIMRQKERGRGWRTWFTELVRH